MAGHQTDSRRLRLSSHLRHLQQISVILLVLLPPRQILRGDPNPNFPVHVPPAVRCSTSDQRSLLVVDRPIASSRSRRVVQTPCPSEACLPTPCPSPAPQPSLVVIDPQWPPDPLVPSFPLFFLRRFCCSSLSRSNSITRSIKTSRIVQD